MTLPSEGVSVISTMLTIVATDLRNSELFTPIGPSGLPNVSFPQVTAPDFGAFASTGAQNLIQGFVQANGDGTITVGCYVYDVAAQSELAPEMQHQFLLQILAQLKLAGAVDRRAHDPPDASADRVAPSTVHESRKSLAGGNRRVMSIWGVLISRGRAARGS